MNKGYWNEHAVKEDMDQATSERISERLQEDSENADLTEGATFDS